MKKILGIIVLSLLLSNNIFEKASAEESCYDFIKETVQYNTSNTVLQFDFKNTSRKTIKIYSWGLLRKDGSTYKKSSNAFYLKSNDTAIKQLRVTDLNLNKAGNYEYYCKFEKKPDIKKKKYKPNKSKDGFKWWYLLFAIPVLGMIVQAFEDKDKSKKEKPKTNIKETKSVDDPKQEQTGPKFTGTAFFINTNGHLITNFHVVANSGNRLRIIYDGEEITARIIAKDETLDLAVVKVSTKNKNYIEISDKPLEKMQSIVAAGYPALNLSDDLKLTSGIISSLKGIGNNSALIQIDAALNPGNSGGPIIDKDNGHLAAVAVSGMRGSDYQSINYGIKASRVKEFIESNSIVVPKKSLNSKKLKRKEISEILESSTVLIFH